MFEEVGDGGNSGEVAEKPAALTDMRAGFKKFIEIIFTSDQ